MTSDIRIWDDRSTVCIVLNWNGGDTILRCLQSVRDSVGVHPALLVIDNGSVDGSPEMIESRFPDASLLRQHSNVGLTSARNAGVAWALAREFRFLFFIDDDAYVAPDTLATLVQTAMNSSATGIVSPRILDAARNDRIWFDGGYRNMFGDFLHKNLGAKVSASDHAHSGTPRAIDFASGCCMLVKREVFEGIGGFDEEFFVYSEDADFSARTRAAGLEVMLAPHAISWHHQSSDTKKNAGKEFRDYYVTRNRLLLARRTLHGVRWFVYCIYFILYHCMVPVLYHSITGKPSRVRAILSGVVDYKRGNFGRRQER